MADCNESAVFPSSLLTLDGCHLPNEMWAGVLECACMSPYNTEYFAVLTIRWLNRDANAIIALWAHVLEGYTYADVRRGSGAAHTQYYKSVARMELLKPQTVKPIRPFDDRRTPQYAFDIQWLGLTRHQGTIELKFGDPWPIFRVVYYACGEIRISAESTSIPETSDGNAALAHLNRLLPYGIEILRGTKKKIPLPPGACPGDPDPCRTVDTLNVFQCFRKDMLLLGKWVLAPPPQKSIVTASYSMHAQTPVPFVIRIEDLKYIPPWRPFV